MISDFETTGLLPAGIHWASLKEIEARYGINDCRQRLLRGLRGGLAALAAAGCKTVYLDGSFITMKEFPGDYDACWEGAGVNLSKLDPVLQRFENKRAAQKAKFFGEFFPAHALAESKSPFRTYFDFFQQDKDTGAKKGIIGIKL